MKSSFAISLSLIVCSQLFAADPAAREELTGAIHKLSSQPNYSWKSVIVVPESAQFKPGPTEGKTEKDGFTYVTMSFGGNLTEVVLKGAKAAVTDRDGNWQLASELENAEGGGRFLGRLARNLKTPADQAAELVASVKELKKDGDAYAGDLTEEGARKQFRFGEPQNPKGSVKFWIKDGMLAKYEVKVEAKVEFNGNEIDASRATTTEIKDAGATKVNAPADARKKLS